jgi:hypothetical protein
LGTGAALAGLAAALLAVGSDAAGARSGPDARRDGQRGKPVLAIVSLSDQRISIYDAGGKILESPVSSGSTGYETPAGIFSIVQKKEEHYSNLYEDGEMPFMQRITWTGIALHAGVLPGRPASHGCIRLPMSFAQRLFGLTELGMRVIVVRDDMRPSAIAHPALFKARPLPKDAPLTAPHGGTSPRTRLALASGAGIEPGSAAHLQFLQSVADDSAAELETATSRRRDARAAAKRAAAEAAGAARVLRAAETGLARAEAAVKDAERRLAAASSRERTEQAEAAKVKAVARVGELQAQLQTARAQEQAKREAAERAGETERVASAARDTAAEAAEQAARKTAPVSVLVSRKTQRLYVRRANYPVFEGPVAIRDAQRPIGTFVFTALAPVGVTGEMRWNVVAMYRNPTEIEPAPEGQPRRPGARDVEAAPSDVAAAGAALDRVTLGQDALDIISEVVLPGSSLIISDEGPSRETGKDTDFVVVMSGEPQGALKIRQREPAPMDAFGRGGFGPPPFRGFPFSWN